MVTKKPTARIKGKKKRWYSIVAPAIFRKQTMGELYLYVPEQALGRTMKINLMNLTGDIKKQNTNARFIINRAAEGKLYAEMVGYQIIPTAIKRMIRRRISKVIISFPVKTADNKTIKIKPLILTRGSAKKSILTSLRKKAEELIKAYAEKTKFENMLHDIISHKLQINFKKQLSKIFPLRTFEIKMLNIVKEKAPEIKPKEKKEVKKEKPVKKKEEKPKEEAKKPEEKPKEVKKEKPAKKEEKPETKAPPKKEEKKE